MIRALFTAATGMEAQQLNIDTIAHNLANANTTGFKRGRADFQDLLYQTVTAPGTASSASTEVPAGLQVGLGVKPAAVGKIFAQGDFRNTGGDLDVAIEGDGFFQVVQPNGEIAYTRAGALKRDSIGQLVTSNGYPLEPAITLPDETTSVTIASDGTVSVLEGGSTATTIVGTIELAVFPNPQGLNAIGRNLFIESDSSGDAIIGVPGESGIGTLSQGFLEISNVSIAEELVNMIMSQRAFEVNSKSIQAANEMLQTTNNLIR
ncbi:MAG: flagellar basal-body rod protein FlgG [Nitrospirota bacterium]|jgi:flagellar basal-body rod protein FlgG